MKYNKDFNSMINAVINNLSFISHYLRKIHAFQNKNKTYFIKTIFDKSFSFISQFRRRKMNFLLKSSQYTDNLYKKLLKNYYNQNKELLELYNRSNIFPSSDLQEKKSVLKYIEKNFLNYKMSILEKADELLKHKFHIFDKIYEPKSKINWNHSFFENFNWPNIISFKIDYKTNKNKADIKYNWEFNRNSFLVTLGLAFYFTSDEKYSKEVINIILDWIKSNPPTFNTSWMDQLEASIRLINWIFTIDLIKDSKELNETVFFEIFKSILQHLYFLYSNIQKYALNHTVGEYFAIFLAADKFKDINFFKKLYKYSKKGLKKQISLQTLEDGVNIERSANYHVFTLEFFSLFIILSENSLSQKEYDLINKMYTFLYSIIKPDGSLSLIGDSDNANVIPEIFYKPNFSKYIQLLSIGALIFKRGDLKYISKDLSPLSLFFIGPKSIEEFNKIKESKPNGTLLFKNGGFFVNRNNFTKDSSYLLFDMAEFGPFGSHDHLDISNIIYYYKGVSILTDSGTYRYNINSQIRNRFKGSNAHNLLIIKGQPKIKSKSSFSWDRIPEVQNFYQKTSQFNNLIVKHNIFNNFNVYRKITTKSDLSCIDLIEYIKPIKKKKIGMIRIQHLFHFSENTSISLFNNKVLINDSLIMEIISPIEFEFRKNWFYYSPHYGIIIRSPLLIIDYAEKFYSELLKIKIIIRKNN